MAIQIIGVWTCFNKAVSSKQADQDLPTIVERLAAKSCQKLDQALADGWMIIVSHVADADQDHIIYFVLRKDEQPVVNGENP